MVENKLATTQTKKQSYVLQPQRKLEYLLQTMTNRMTNLGVPVNSQITPATDKDQP